MLYGDEQAVHKDGIYIDVHGSDGNSYLESGFNSVGFATLGLGRPSVSGVELTLSGVATASGLPQ